MNDLYFLYVAVSRRGCVGMLPIHMSALNGYLDCVKKMLSFTPGFQIDTPDNMGRTCLHAAACGGYETLHLIHLMRSSNFIEYFVLQTH